MSEHITTYPMTPIGMVHCPERYRFESPRQSVFAANSGYIELYPDCDYAAAAADLNGFSRIWVVFVFHLNMHWNVKVTPPVAPPGRKIGVLATRSPHRPNRIGMSCVELCEVKNNRIFIRNFDMLDLTPVLDIKPYIPAADSFPDAATDWLSAAQAEENEIVYQPRFREKCSYITAAAGPDLENFCAVQLRFSPLDTGRKRLTQLGGELWEIGCRTWRILFAISASERRINVLDIRSNLVTSAACDDTPDKYGDLQLQLNYAAVFGAGYDV